MEIKENWKTSDLYKKGKIELIPTGWVWNYWGRDVTPIDLNSLWKDICDNGLNDPLIMRIGLINRKFRLEAGNHRIQVFYKNNIEMIPVTVQIQDYCGPEANNLMTDAQHNFDFNNDISIPDIIEEYMKPSEIFKNLKTFID